MMGDNFTPTPRRQLRGQNRSVGIRLIELTEPSGTLNYKPFLNSAFYTLFYTFIRFTSFYCLYLSVSKSFVLKTELYFKFF